MAVGVAAGAGEEVPVERPAHVGGDRVAELLGVERDRVVLVDRLAVEHRLDRRAVVVGARLVVAAGELGHVAVLPHVEVEPVVVVEPRRGAVAARRVEGHQVRAAVALAQAAGHGADDRLVRVVLDRPVAAEDPDDAACPCSAGRATRRRPRRSRGVKSSGPSPHFLFHLSPQVGRKPMYRPSELALSTM